jgi:peptidoglycan/LPS O-acetylase OafA/YrhL
MQRLYYFDNIKVLLIVIVIFMHAGMAYVPVAELWPVSFPTPFPVADLLVVGTFQAIGSSFAMALFFFISAYLLVGSFDRKGQKKFLKDRFVRIGIPLFGIVAFLLILTAAVGANSATSSFSWLFLITVKGANSATFSIGWLWFLVFLLILAVAYSVWRTLHITIPPVPCPGNGTLVLAALALGVANYAVRRRYGPDQWVLWHAVEPAHVLLYVLFMLGGILAYRNGWLETVSPSLVRTWGIISVVGLCGIPVLIAPLFPVPSLLYSLWEAFLGIGICVTLLIVCKHRWNTTGRIKAVLAKNVYAAYIIQIPIIVFLQSRFIQGGVLIPEGLPPLLQFVLVGVLATAFCFLISNYVIRKIPYAERVLF